MTSENPQIQALLQQISEVLNKTNPRLPWVMSSDAVQQRQVLEQTRDYLLLLQQNGISKVDSPEPGGTQPAATMEASAQQVLQAVVQEMNYLRSNMMQPLRSDIEMLRMQREALTQEIRQLEAQRQQYGLPQQNPQYLTEFLQAAMTQMQEKLATQVAQMLATATTDPQQLAGTQTVGLLTGGSASVLSPIERLERLQMLQSQSDQVVLRLDTTLRTVFESLQQNIQSYQDSLEEGLGRMHGMGQEGEAVFGAFVTRLGQILGREASSFLQSPPARSDRPSLPGQPEVEDYPDRQINRLLEELNALDQTALRRAALGEPIPFDPPADLSPEAELEKLAELDRVLSQLDLSEIPEADQLDEEELVLLQEDFPFATVADQGWQNSRSTVEMDPDRVVRRANPVQTEEDLESALDLLNQITSETSTDPRWHGSDRTATAEPAEPFASSSLDSPLIANPDALYQDEFNQILDEAEASDRADQVDQADNHSMTEVAPQPQAEALEQVDATTDLDAGLFAGLSEFEASDGPLRSSALPPLSQSVENRLLPSPPASQSQGETWDDFFSGEEETGIGEESEAEAIETIAALTDLIPPASSDPAPGFVEPPRLLDLGGESEFSRPESPDTVQQLSADLFNLDNTAPAAAPDRIDRTLGDWQDSPSVEPLPPTEGIEWSLTDIPSVLLSHPFSGEMTAEDLLFIDQFVEDMAANDTIANPGARQAADNTSTPAVEAQPDASADALINSTLADWFSAIDAEPVVTSDITSDVTSEGTATDEPDNLNAFTLDGLDSLFEGVPSIDAAPPSSPESQQQKKK